MRLPVSILVVVLMLAAFSSPAQVTYWFSGWQRSGTAQQAQQYFMVPGTGVSFTYATNRVIINSTGVGTNFFTTNNFYYTNSFYTTNNIYVTNNAYYTNNTFVTNVTYDSVWTNDTRGVWVRGNQTNLLAGFLSGFNNTANIGGSTVLGINVLDGASGSKQSSVFLGNSVGTGSSADADYSVFIGHDTAVSSANTLNTVVAIGNAPFSSYSGPTAFDSVAIGNQPLSSMSANAVGTVAIGAYAGGQSSGSLGLSVTIGDTSSYQNTKDVDNSVMIGNQALAYNTGAFQQSVAIGYNAQITNAIDLTNVVALGGSSSVTKNNQMALGHNITDYIIRDVNYSWPASGGPGVLTNSSGGDLGWSVNPTINTVTATNGLYYIPENSAGVYTNLHQPLHAFAALMGFVTNTINGGANTYAIVTNYSTARTNDMRCSLTTGCITNLEAGLYYCAIHMSAKSLDNGALVEGDLLLNGVVRDEVSFQSEFDPGAPRWKGVSAFGILYIPANTQITFQIKSSGASGIQLRRQQLVVFSP